MPAIADTDVTYTENRRADSDASAKVSRGYDIDFGDGALTYPAGGVPLDSGKLGVGYLMTSLVIEDADNSNGFLYKYDKSNNKIRIYQGDNDNVADAALIELGAVAIAAVTLKVEVKGR
jgi:hypothetical protein